MKLGCIGLFTENRIKIDYLYCCAVENRVLLLQKAKESRKDQTYLQILCTAQTSKDKSVSWSSSRKGVLTYLGASANGQSLSAKDDSAKLLSNYLAFKQERHQ
ncbi:MAG: hypothetical protein EXX96DRAFT_535814 [Benjaminiella poitrasii]|nr:MAG: hypothetical protein EXX96DRAFT_535814 [Benjaminiella poitrasii]